MTGLEFLYKTVPGRACLKVLTRPGLSRAVGRFLDKSASRVLIRPFVRGNGIDLSEFESDDFRCFNDCFCRKIKPGRRVVDMDETALISPCDGLLSVYPVTQGTILPVKQSAYTLSALLGGDPAAGDYDGGTALVFRLCVDNYHRYCYVDSGAKSSTVRLPGVLHTVRPIALEREPVFVENAREYTFIDSKRFGRLVQMEVGALLVGRIENHLPGPGEVLRGQEKGTFLYGGSTIIVLLRPGAALLDPLFTGGGETPVKYGQRIGQSAAAK